MENNIRILVLGGYGFIVSHICQKLKSEGHTVGIVDCFHQYYTYPDWEYHPVLNQRKSITIKNNQRKWTYIHVNPYKSNQYL